jgi:hypothetical protein
MQKDSILSEAKKEERRQTIEKNRRKKHEKYKTSTTLDLVRIIYNILTKSIVYLIAETNIIEKKDHRISLYDLY